MNIFKSRINKSSKVVIAVTMITCITIYNVHKPNAYQVYVNGKSIAYVSDVNKVGDINKDIAEEISNRFSKVSISSTVSYGRVNAEKKALSDEETLKKNILNTIDVSVDAVEMNIDGKKMGILANENEGDKVISSVSNYYLSKCELLNKKISGVKNDVKYIPIQIEMSMVNNIEDIVNSIIKVDVENNNPVLSVEVIGSISEKVPIGFSTITKWNDTILKGNSKVTQKGESGSKAIEKLVTTINNKKVRELILKETVVVKAKDEIIEKGTKVDANSSAVMAVPSRGVVSSSFGMRQGRMHEGIDIAASQGTPIYAAEAGVVVFAGWEEGYGNVIKIEHKDNMLTLYGHCSKLATTVNKKITKGQLIGYVGSTGRSTGPHLHFEVRVNGKAINPNPYIYNAKSS